jgi:hypothetical protein
LSDSAVGLVSLREHVDRFYSIAGRNPAMPPGVGPLALDILGPEAFEVPTGPIPAGSFAHLVKHDGQWRIRVFEAAPREELSISVARALAHWYRDRFAPEDRLPIDDLAARLLLPMQCISICGQLGYDVGEIAAMFGVPLRIAALRWREVFSPSSSGSFSRIELTA